LRTEPPELVDRVVDGLALILAFTSSLKSMRQSGSKYTVKGNGLAIDYATLDGHPAWQAAMRFRGGWLRRCPHLRRPLA
jgi:hypothetical protein